MKAWIYRHPILAVLIPYLPTVVAAETLALFGFIQPWLSFLASSWVLLLLFFGVRRIGQGLVTDAFTALERDLDPTRFLALTKVLKSRRIRRPDIRLMIETNYAEGIDAAGHPEEALSYMNLLAADRARLDPYSRAQFDLAYAAIAVHSEKGRESLPLFLGKLDQEIAAFPGNFANALRASFDTVRDAMRFYAGETEGLVPKYVRAIEATRENPLHRRRHIIACTWLARVYEKEGRTADAAAMYGYVAKNGGGLALAAEARGALSRLGEKKDPSATADEKTVKAEESSSTFEENTREKSSFCAENLPTGEKPDPSGDGE